MKVLFLALLYVGFAAADTATGAPQTESTPFGKWRACIITKIPAEKHEIMSNCLNKPSGSDMAKFRRGVACVLDSYGIVSKTRVDLSQMSAVAATVTSAEMKKALEDCSKDVRNTLKTRTIKCVIDRLETSCPKE